MYSVQVLIYLDINALPCLILLSNPSGMSELCHSRQHSVNYFQNKILFSQSPLALRTEITGYGGYGVSVKCSNCLICGYLDELRRALLGFDSRT
jgi:hypothetical protein